MRYIIIGAGSAGCVLANRLSENSENSVFILEAGGYDDDPNIHIPARWNSLLGSHLDWAYQSEPQEQLSNRQITLNRGKVLGGTSAINGMVYMRGHPKDFDRWAELGCQGWAWRDVLPYFKKLEHFEGDDLHYGQGGPINISIIPDVLNQHERFLTAAEQIGLKRNPNFNGETQEGAGLYHHTVKKGERQSTADAYLKPALNRQNLKLKTRAQVTRIFFEKQKAVGLEYVQNNQVKELYADELILSSGAINSPQILLNSGIGPAEDLEPLGIATIQDLPGVGKNLQDHPMLNLKYQTRKSQKLDTAFSTAAYQDYIKDKAGFLLSTRTFAGGFWKTREDLELPDMQFYMAIGERHDDFDCAIGLSLTRPKSRGQLTLRSSNPFDYPRINPNYLDNPYDLEVYIKSVKKARAFKKTEAFKDFLDTELEPDATIQTNKDIELWIRNTLTTLWHYSGTCKMGHDEFAVVDRELKVHGIEGLRVVDASVIPEITGGNINAPVLMIAEKAADIIKNTSTV